MKRTSKRNVMIITALLCSASILTSCSYIEFENKLRGENEVSEEGEEVSRVVITAPPEKDESLDDSSVTEPSDSDEEKKFFKMGEDVKFEYSDRFHGTGAYYSIEFVIKDSGIYTSLEEAGIDINEMRDSPDEYTMINSDGTFKDGWSIITVDVNLIQFEALAYETETGIEYYCGDFGIGYLPDATDPKDIELSHSLFRETDYFSHHAPKENGSNKRYYFFTKPIDETLSSDETFRYGWIINTDEFSPEKLWAYYGSMRGGSIEPFTKFVDIDLEGS